MGVQHDCHLIHPFQFRGYFLLGIVTDHSHVSSVQRELVTHASVFPAPIASSLSPNVNGGTDLQVFDASDCSTLRLLRVDRMRKWESKDF